MAESVENLRMIRRRNLQHMRRAYCSWKAGAADWFVHKFESNKDCGELPDPESNDGRSTSEKDSVVSIVELSWIETTSVTSGSRQVPLTRHNRGLKC